MSHRYSERDVDRVFGWIAIVVLVVIVGTLAYQIFDDDPEVFGAGVAPTQVQIDPCTGIPVPFTGTLKPCSAALSL